MAIKWYIVVAHFTSAKYPESSLPNQQHTNFWYFGKNTSFHDTRSAIFFIFLNRLLIAEAFTNLVRLSGAFTTVPSAVWWTKHPIYSINPQKTIIQKSISQVGRRHKLYLVSIFRLETIGAESIVTWLKNQDCFREISQQLQCKFQFFTQS